MSERGRVGMLCPWSPTAMVRMLATSEDSVDRASSVGF
jgi:hypothetical protein